MLAPWSCQTWTVPNRIDRLGRARLYLVCDGRSGEFLDAALRGGVDIVQLRMKDSSDERIVAVAERFANACAAHDALFILNDRPDLMAAAGADGVHLGQDDTPVSRARSIVGPDRIVGLSTHTPEQIEAARDMDVDYIGVGPVHATPTKPGRPAVGYSLVSYAAMHASVPFFAIGGIAVENVAHAAAAGAERVAVVRALTEADDPERTASELRAAITAQESRVGTA
jgi:thiamine-phosphate pyrophosphorylase